MVGGIAGSLTGRVGFVGSALSISCGRLLMPATLRTTRLLVCLRAYFVGRLLKIELL